MDLGLRGKTAIVAAASQGLGKGVAHALAAEGANVVMFSRILPAIQAAALQVQAAAGQQTRVLGLAADVTRIADLEHVVKTTVDSFGSVDVLFNNAGGPKPGMFDTLTDDDWQGAFELNLMSAIRLTRRRRRTGAGGRADRRRGPGGGRLVHGHRRIHLGDQPERARAG